MSIVVCSLVKMLLILVLCPVLLTAGVQTLTIDSQLGTSIEDCFDRIAIGEQLPNNAIYRNISELTTRECEQLCKQDKQCQTYDYGVGAKGNATCNLSNLDEKELKENNLLHRHPDYDIYIRRIQCEQAPPTPLQPQFDDPGDGPLHRPVFRPDEDEPRRPLADDFPPTTDSRPYETRPDLLRPIPPYRPHKPPYNNAIDQERPDDYDNLKPDYDRPPSYGAHKPQDIPYRPERPQQNQPSNTKPDPYDVLQFQEPYKRPSRPQNPQSYRPDPQYPANSNDEVPDPYGHKPGRPGRPFSDRPDPYRPEEKPDYQYIIRPNKKPYRPQRPQDDTGYGLKPSGPVQDYPTKPNYGPEGPSRPGPIGPPDRPYRPNRPYDYPYRPHDRPSYSYHGQYASNYGQSQNQDNSIYLEIIDPPTPYKPSKPLNDRPNYGSSQGDYGYGSPGSYSYGSSYSNQNSYSQSQSIQSQHYSGTVNQNDDHGPNYNRPSHDHFDSKPHRPGYGIHPPSGHLGLGYGSPPGGYGSQKPHDPPEKPSHSSDHGYGGSQTLYGSSNSDYTSSQNSYGGSSQSYGGNNRPSSSQHGYGSSQGSYGGNSQVSQGGSNRPSYGSSSQNDYGGNQQGNKRPSYGSNSQSDYNSNQGAYGNRPSYESSSQSDYSSSQASYGSSQASYGSSQSSYGSSNRPSYGGNNQAGYGSQQGSYGGSSHSQSDYGNRPSYGDNRPSYGDDRPYDHKRPAYDDKRPSYGDDRPSHANQYGSSDSGYNSQSSSGYDSQSGYGQSSYGGDKPGYDQKKPSNQTYGYKPDRPDVKPVYEYEVEKPTDVPSYIARPNGQVVTSRPVTIGDYGERPGYGRDPGQEVSYKGKWDLLDLL